jgi:hypothetical protein
MPIKVTTEINESASVRIQTVVTDFNGTTGVDTADISTATMTITDLRTGVTINSRSAIDVSNGNNGATHDASGNFSITLASADMAINSNSKSIDEEIRVVLFIFTKTDGTVLPEELWLTVKNLKEVS